MNTIEKNGLKINSTLFDFINKEAIPETNVNPEIFWFKFGEALSELAPLNKRLLDERENIQKKIDEWHVKRSDKNICKEEYIKFLKDINYIVEEKDDFAIETSNVDNEISSIAGPQLVVPVDNARYALNAANARWGSFYDALYGTDIIPGKRDHGYNPIRGKKVITYVRNFLEDIAPIKKGSWQKISKIIIEGNDLIFFIDNK